MALRLSIENEASLPDGGPLNVTLSGKRGLDIGRDQHLDWTLPDPTRTISSKHCEIRFHDGVYWLHDVSTNGTFINGSDRRVQGPHRLRHGDRIEIGHYIIAVALDGDEVPGLAGMQDAQAAAPLDSAALWDPTEEAAPPLQRRELQPARETRPVMPDFSEWAIDVPAPPSHLHMPPAGLPHAQPSPEDLAWASRPASPPVSVEPATPVPTPRRPASQFPPAGSPWDDTSPFNEASAGLPTPEQPISVPRGEARATPADEQTSFPPQPIHQQAGFAGDPEILARFARGAGIPEEVIAWRDPDEFAELLGQLMRLVAEGLKQLLIARAESKRLARSTDQTMVQALDNNPLKFSPTPEDALRLMFGRSTSGYLDAQRTFEQTFKDLKVHQVKTYGAMQHALRLLMEDLDPQAIDEGTSAEKGLGGLLNSRKARLWDTYVARWQAKTAPHEDGLVDAFMLYFAECYDRSGQKSR
jgi:type VI secretion system protein ImpI